MITILINKKIVPILFFVLFFSLFIVNIAGASFKFGIYIHDEFDLGTVELPVGSDQ